MNRLFSSNKLTMLRLYFISFFVIIYVFTFAQIITTVPSFPVENRSVTIIFDATGTALENIQGDVYAHTGVIIRESDKSTGNWAYVIAPWPSNPNDNIPKAKLTSTSANIWELHIANIRAFYGVPGTVQKIYQLAFVFRNAGGTSQTGNLYVDLYDETLNVRIEQPVSGNLNPVIVELGSELLIRAIAGSVNEDVVSISLYEDGNFLFEETESDTLEYLYEVLGSDKKILKVVAMDLEGEQVADSITLVVNPSIVDIALPPGIEDGINYHVDQPDQVTLSIYAPYKSFIYVIGDFNDWQVDEQYFMNRDFYRTDSIRFWLTIDSLDPGREYAFQYLIDGELRIADPYTEKVLDPWNDPEIITRGVYPGLKTYPYGKTENLVSVFQTDKPAFNWTIDTFIPPPVEELVIYELLVRDFLQDRSYKTLADTLDYLQQLGVNAIELMPINQFEGNLSWGYNPSFFFAPDKFYGPADQLKRFIDEAHKRGIAVILDMVWNHSFGLSPMLRMYFDSENDRPSNENPWYHDQIFVNQGLRFGYKFNHGSPDFQRFMRRANQYWMEEFKVDGFRFDLTKGFTTRIKGGNDPWASLYDQERVNNLSRVADEIWDHNPNAYVILEHLADNSEEQVLSYYGMLLWGNMNHQYNEATMGYVSDLRWGVYRERGWTNPHLITYMESHDEERLVYRNLQFGNALGDYNTKDLPTALDRIGLASAFFYTIPGPKMLWQFGELGYDFSINRCPNGTIDPDCRTDPKPLRWNYLNDPDRLSLFNLTSDLIYLKRNFQAFNTRDFDYLLETPVKRVRLKGDDLKVVSLGNFRVVASQIRASFYHTGMWYDYISGDSLMVTDTSMIIRMQPGEYYVYLDRKVDRPSGDYSTSIEYTSHSTLDLSVFPNPSAGSIVYIAGDTKDPFDVKITDLQGTIVYVQHGLRLGGRTELQLSESMRPGVYVITLTGVQGSKSMKWVKY